MDLEHVERELRQRLDALGPAPRAELLHVLVLPTSSMPDHLDATTVKESHLNRSAGGKRVMRHPLSAFADRLRDELGLRHEEREARGLVMRHSLSAFADRLRAKAEVRRKRDVKRAAKKMPTGMGNREWHGVPLDMHVPVPPGQRNPRGRDGRRL